jgi:hypothetical protein
VIQPTCHAVRSGESQQCSPEAIIVILSDMDMLVSRPICAFRLVY